MAKRVHLNPFTVIVTVASTLIVGSILLWWALTPPPMYCVHDGKVMTVENRAVHEGMKAGVAGKSYDDCPYSSPQREHPHWVRGWMEGKAASASVTKKK